QTLLKDLGLINKQIEDLNDCHSALSEGFPVNTKADLFDYREAKQNPARYEELKRACQERADSAEDWKRAEKARGDSAVKRSGGCPACLGSPCICKKR